MKRNSNPLEIIQSHNRMPIEKSNVREYKLWSHLKIQTSSGIRLPSIISLFHLSTFLLIFLKVQKSDYFKLFS